MDAKTRKFIIKLFIRLLFLCYVSVILLHWKSVLNDNKMTFSMAQWRHHRDVSVHWNVSYKSITTPIFYLTHDKKPFRRRQKPIPDVKDILKSYKQINSISIQYLASTNNSVLANQNWRLNKPIGTGIRLATQVPSTWALRETLHDCWSVLVIDTDVHNNIVLLHLIQNNSLAFH